MKWFLLSTALLSTPAMAQECIDTELVLLADVSGSMNNEEKKIVRDGHVAAFRNGAVIDQILRSDAPCGAIYATYIEWATTQDIIIGWTLIDSDEAAEDFAAALEAAPISKKAGSRTYLSAAMDFAAQQIVNNGVSGQNRVIDILADGRDDSPVTPAQVVDRYSGPKVPVWERMTFNGLPVIESPDVLNGTELVRYFNEEVIGGPWSRTIPAKGFEDVPRAIVEKLQKELS